MVYSIRFSLVRMDSKAGHRFVCLFVFKLYVLLHRKLCMRGELRYLHLFVDMHTLDSDDIFMQKGGLVVESQTFRHLTKTIPR